jgi:tripartite-type tricarboxylate transporter receptor subunit TctC
MQFAGSHLLTSLVSFIKAGRVRTIATLMLNRLALFPDVPTANESGLPGFEVSPWLGMLAPARTPDAIIRRLHDEIVKTIPK